MRMVAKRRKVRVRIIVISSTPDDRREQWGHVTLVRAKR
jgi:hypothetical protein